MSRDRTQDGDRLEVACFSCQEPFDARQRAGLVRCGACEDRQAFRLPGVGSGTVTVVDTPGEAWA